MRYARANARVLAERLAAIDGLSILTRVETNIVVFEPPVQWDPAALVRAAEQRGVLLTLFGGRRLRAMTHPDVSLADCDTAAAAIASIVSARARQSTIP